MEDGHFVSEAMMKLSGDLWRQRNFRDEQQRSASHFEGRVDRVQVHFGFARAVTPSSRNGLNDREAMPSAIAS